MALRPARTCWMAWLPVSAPSAATNGSSCSSSHSRSAPSSANVCSTSMEPRSRREGVSQTDLAGKLEISASYLNLIEHNQRPLPAHLLVKLAQVFSVDIATFADDSATRLAADLQEVFGDPLFEEHPVTLSDTRELAENATATRAIVALYRA